MPITYADRGPSPFDVVESAAGVRDSTDGRWGAFSIETFATQAWLDASWRVSTAQAPSVAACGATREEAVDRLNSERLLSPDHVSDEWWAWRWGSWLH